MGKYKRWNDSELRFIVDNQQVLKDEDIAAKLAKMTGENITADMIRAQRRKLKIKKRRGRKKQNISICVESSDTKDPETLST
jgi:hypothetical protein